MQFNGFISELFTFLGLSAH